jgi:hypothetical protein
MDPALDGAQELRINTTHSGQLIAIPPPQKTLIEEACIRASVSSGFMHRHGYLVTLRAMNAWVTYRLETLERGAWVARLVEWSTI